MSKYTQSILIFGLILPCGLLLLAVGGVVHARSKIQFADRVKSQKFSEYSEASSKLQLIESELSSEGRRDQMAYWEEQLGKDFIQSLTQNLNEITEEFDENQLVRTELSRPSSRSPIASTTENDYARFKLSFDGGFGPMQKTMAELEMRMPQLVLESLEVSTSSGNYPGSTPKLKFDAVYLCWQDTDENSNRR